ncbi:MAG: HlyD family efflux transporter periplasmic adaptor subunit [Lachnospiraceae bacterium]|nr:HlyD family efflux transporter periplasmic adaptor subunit [Lachnospiraceae bacterium]
MSKKKKVLLFVIITVIVAVGIGFAYSYLKKKNRASKTVNVYAVSEIGYYGGYYYENMLYGNVTSTNEQKVYINSNQKISEIKVKEGDQVKVGDVLLVYDTTAQGLQLNTLATEVELARVAVLVAERELEELKEITPVEETTETPTTEAPTTEVPTTETPTTEAPTTENPTTEAPTTENPTTEEPGNQLPGIIPGATPSDATGTDAEKPGVPSTEAPSTEAPNTEAPSTETPSTEASSTEAPSTEAPSTEDPESQPSDEDMQETEELTEEKTYTEKELKQAIKDKEAEIKRLNIAYQMIQVSYQIMEAQNATGELVCTCNGVVRTVLDEETAIANNEPLIVVGEADGYIVNTQIGELSLGKVNIGDSVSMMCYDDGMTYEGIITSISEIPYDENYYGDPSESYYPMTVSVMNADNLYAGMYMEISLSDNGGDSDIDDMYTEDEFSEGEQDSLYLSGAFVKYENGGYYVYKEVDGILKKCQVAVGTVSYGDIEIVGGLTYDDYIAFPYSADTVEGVKTKHESSDKLYY